MFKNSRKVIIKQTDKKENVGLPKSIEKKKEKIIIEVKHNTKTKCPVNKLKEIYPHFKAQSLDRIVPLCLRTKCSQILKEKKCILQENKRKKKRKGKSVNKNKIQNIAPLPISSLAVNNANNINLQYEDISSGNLSSIDEEIDALLVKTRKRMKNVHNNWEVTSKHTTCSPVSVSTRKSLSINSLDTLVLVEDETESYEVYDPQNEPYSPTMSPDKLIQHEHVETYTNNSQIDNFSRSEESIYDSDIIEDYFKKNEIKAVITNIEKMEADDISSLAERNMNTKQDLYDI